MKILLATSEAFPLAKTGGLADVCGSLPIELARLGHEITLIMPAYRQVLRGGAALEPTGVQLDIPIGAKTVSGTFLKTHLPGTQVPVLLAQHDPYFDRPELYSVDGKDYKDNCERFVFFSRMVLEAVRTFNLAPDVIHANDWQAGLVPAYLKLEYCSLPQYDQIGTLLTIHNMAYQGIFWHWDMLLTGLDWKYFNWYQMEFFGSLNLLKTGLVFADRLNSVSRRYAEEIQSAPLGCGLEGVLQTRRDVLSGIVNGVDYSEWNPATDNHLPERYSSETVVAGKARCKAALQAEMSLPAQPGVPLLAFVGRLVDQKGIDLIAAVMREWVGSQPAQWVLLGTGDPNYHELFTGLAKRFPQKVAVRLEFSGALAHRIEAGADVFLMPSRYEPCGLNQLYSLKYGTVPIVRATGGLADTIVDATEESLTAGQATGFTFREYGAPTLAETIKRALALYDDRDRWLKLMRTGMAQDWSWTHSAREYVELYQRTIDQVRECEAAGATT